MKKSLLSVILILFTLSIKAGDVSSAKTVSFKATDGLDITADLYMTPDENAPLILLFHQATYSRGEYIEIAPILNALGFNCLAIDQRSGLGVNGVKNETHKAAKKLKLATKYVNAIPDLIGTYNYANNILKSKQIIVWGSSYSAALAIYLGGLYPNDIKGILSFSPGEYFKIDNQEIQTYANKINCPVFMTSAKSEQEAWQKIYDNIQSEKSFYLPKLKGNHGSKALWAEKESHKEYWAAVKTFLVQFLD